MASTLTIKRTWGPAGMWSSFGILLNGSLLTVTVDNGSEQVIPLDDGTQYTVTLQMNSYYSQPIAFTTGEKGSSEIITCIGELTGISAERQIAV